MTRDLKPFVPHPLLPGGHLQTIAGYYLPGPNHLQRTKLHQIALDDGDRLVVCENRGNRKAPIKKQLLLMHGLGGSADSPYMLRLADLFGTRGWRVFRMNHRGCGQGDGLAWNGYHSGRSDDISAVLGYIEALAPGVPTVAVGFSLSGNALLKLLGERIYPVAGNLAGAIAVTPPIELARSADALSKLQNRIYELRFLHFLRQAVQSRRRRFHDFPEIRFEWGMSLRDFDERCTAPLNNFQSAQDYYDRCSAKQFLRDIEHPTLLLASLDDPFIPAASFDDLPANPKLEYLLTDHGGHMGFIAAEPTPLRTLRWMDYVILTCAERFVSGRGN